MLDVIQKEGLKVNVCVCVVCVVRDNQVLTHQLCKEMRVRTRAFMCAHEIHSPRGITHTRVHAHTHTSTHTGR